MRRLLLIALLSTSAPAYADTINFGQFGANGAAVANGAAGLTGGNVSFTVTGPGQGFTRLDEEAGWAGHFPDGTPLLYNNGAAGAGEILFGQSISSLTGLSMQANLTGAYTATAQVWLGGVLQGSTFYNSVNNLDVPPAIPTFDFTAFASFDRLVLSTTNDGLGWAIGGVIGGAVPEPATWALLILGFGFVGGAMRQRARTSVSYA